MNYTRFFILSVITVLLASCASRKSSMLYFEGIEDIENPALGEYSVKIEPSDELFIAVTSENPEASEIYNLPYANPARRDRLLATSTPQQQTYTVDPEGYINFPVLGRIYVKGLTVDELRKILVDKISKDVDNPLVTVKLVNYYINMMGEVRSTGRYQVTSPRYTILDAIAAAGDLTQYARRDNVLLIREENGERKHVRLDLTSADVLSSPYFYVKQNDIIYVEPNEIRQDNAEYNTFNAFRVQVASVIVSGAATIVSLLIALTK